MLSFENEKPFSSLNFDYQKGKEKENTSNQNAQPFIFYGRVYTIYLFIKTTLPYNS